MTRSPIPVERAQIPYWQERGWTRRKGGYFGQYTVNALKFEGKATESAGGDVEMFIKDTDELARIMRGHHKWACFVSQGSGWLFIHTNNDVRDVSAGLIEVESLLGEGLNHKERKPSSNYEQIQIPGLSSLLRRLIG